MRFLSFVVRKGGENMKKKGSIAVIALLFVAVLTAVVVFNTYAKYTDSVTKNGSATVAKWNFSTDNSTATYTMNFNDSVDASTLVNGKFAPGTSGSFEIALANSSEVGVNVTVSFGSVSAGENGVVPSGLKFYLTRTGNAGSYSYSNEITPGTTSKSGTMAAKTGNSNETLSATVYWVWDYENTAGDVNDTAAGVAGSTLSLPITITGTQVSPSSTAITTAWN